ncbi:MAG: hypothetical protein IMF18_01245 [Proteobacteria bacterium]|nr:hypothetical protein [Pseudomonadota bacterium]
MRGFIAILFCAVTCSAHADEWEFGGHLKYQLTQALYESEDLYAVYGDDTPTDHEIDIRLKARKRWDRWDATIHYELLALAGDSLETRQALTDAGLLSATARTGLPSDDRRLFDLTDEITDKDRLAAVHRLDRLYIGYAGEHIVVRAGRQAVSWGNGIAFNPLDIFNPFSPTAVDKDYKTGDDMLYGQWLFENGDDLQAIFLPRRDPVSNEVKSDQSSYTLKYHGMKAGMDYDLLVACHYDEALLGVGLARDWHGAVWRLDVSITELDGGGRATSLVTNLDYSWTWFGRNVYGYVEYFRSGVGEAHKNYAKPNTDLQKRISRGELFNVGRDYLATGLEMELTPLFHLFPSMICNLNDESVFVQVRATYDWKENILITCGINLPYGKRGSEFGGIPSGITDRFDAPGDEGYVRISYYF